jgi:hypothetical protein
MDKTIQQKYTDLIEELYRSFDFFNEHFCKGELKRPIITTQGDKREGSTYGWFGKQFWLDNSAEEGVYIDELNLTAESLHRDPEQVLETLLHEMAHLKNAQADIHDCTKSQYHNDKFKAAAEFFGLEVSRRKGKGWATTKLDEKALGVIALLKPKTELYKIVRRPPKVEKPEPKVIMLNVGLEYEDKIAALEDFYGKKRELTEQAIDMLYDDLIKNKNGE